MIKTTMMGRKTGQMQSARVVSRGVPFDYLRRFCPLGADERTRRDGEDNLSEFDLDRAARDLAIDRVQYDSVKRDAARDGKIP